MGDVLFRILACDREEKYDDLVKEFSGNVRSWSQPDLCSRTSAENSSLSRTMYKFFATVTLYLAPAIGSSTALKPPPLVVLLPNLVLVCPHDEKLSACRSPFSHFSVSQQLDSAPSSEDKHPAKTLRSRLSRSTYQATLTSYPAIPSMAPTSIPAASPWSSSSTAPQTNHSTRWKASSAA